MLVGGSVGPKVDVLFPVAIAATAATPTPAHDPCDDRSDSSCVRLTTGDGSMADVTGTLLKHRKRLNEIAAALARHGLAAWAARGGGIAGLAPIENLVHRVVSEEDVERV